MKELFFTMVVLFSVFSMTAQKQNDSIASLNKKQNEIKLNGLMLLVGAFEVIYERNLNAESSVGISFFYPYNSENIDADLKFYVSPYYRKFFNKKYAQGFFIEGFGMLNSMDKDVKITGTDGSFLTEEKTVTDFALGFGIGGKWATKSGFVFELSGGFGRNLIENYSDLSGFIGKFGFNLGYRF